MKTQIGNPAQGIQSQNALSFKQPLLVLFMAISLVALSAFVSAPRKYETGTESTSIGMNTETGGAHLLFAGKYGGNIKKSEYMGQTDLQVEGCAKGSKIFTYTLEVNHNGKMTKHQGKSDALTNEMIATLNVLDKGDSFEFKSTKAYLPNGKDVVDVTSMKFLVV